MLYKITVSFSNKTIYLDPKDGKSAMSRALDGVLPVLRERKDIENHEEVVANFIKQARELIRRFEQDGYIGRVISKNYPLDVIKSGF